MESRIAQAFAARKLVRPTFDEPDMVHLVRAIAAITGVKDFDVTPPVERLISEIGQAPHIVFILLDGLGMNIISRLPPESFLKQHVRLVMRATSPSTTACALTSIATGHWPGQHGITGWFTYLPEHSLTITPLPFTERFSQRSLAEQLKATDVLPVPAFYPHMTHHNLTLLPIQIVNTTYATWARGYTPGQGFTSYADAVDKILAQLSTATAPTYTHWYVPDVDSLCHHRGITYEGVDALVGRLDAALVRLAEGMPAGTRLIISADHGLIDVPVSSHMHIHEGDSLLDLLACPPTGDARLPVFHVREGRREEFVEEFNSRFGHSMSLLSTDQAEEMGLFGPRPWNSTAKRRFGDFVGIADRPATLHYIQRHAPPKATKEPYLAQHAGLSPDEMLIPLIIA